MVIWLTGLSGAGKTSIGDEINIQLQKRGMPCVRLDGDAFRVIVDDPHTGHDRRSRIINAYRISRFAHYLESQNLLVIVSTMSLFHEVHNWNRGNFKSYFEVLIDVDINQLLAIDDKGIYGASKKGKLKHVVGQDIDAELPVSPSLILHNDHSKSLRELADIVIHTALKAL